MAESNKYQNLGLYDTEDDYKSSLKFSQDSSSKLCSFYANGYCKYGQNCKFLHQRNNYSASKISRKTLSPRKIDDNRSNSVKKCTSDTAANQTKYHSNSSDGNISKKRLCRYFRAGHCKNGKNCLFSHNLDKVNWQTNIKFQLHNGKNSDVNNTTISIPKEKSVPVCQYFRRGLCKKGDRCNFYHNSKQPKENFDSENSNSGRLSELDNLDGNNSEQLCLESVLNGNLHTENSSKNLFPSSSNYTGPLDNVVSSSSKNVSYSQGSCNVNLYKSENSEDLNTLNINSNSSKGTSKYQSQISLGPWSFNLSTLSEESLHELRNTEIAQLKTFPKSRRRYYFFSFIYEPSDPDWSRDFRSLRLQVTFPECYPLEVCSITALKHKDYIPAILLRFANCSNCLEFHQKTEKNCYSMQPSYCYRK